MDAPRAATNWLVAIDLIIEAGGRESFVALGTEWLPSPPPDYPKKIGGDPLSPPSRFRLTEDEKRQFCPDMDWNADCGAASGPFDVISDERRTQLLDDLHTVKAAYDRSIRKVAASKKQAELHAKALLRESNALACEVDALTKRAVALIDLINQPDPLRGGKPLARVVARVKPLPLDVRTVRDRGWHMTQYPHQRRRAMALSRLLLRELRKLSGTMSRMLEPVVERTQVDRDTMETSQLSFLAWRAEQNRQELDGVGRRLFASALPAVFERHFGRRATISRPSGGGMPGGKYLEFAREVTRQFGLVSPTGGEYSVETIARYLPPRTV